MKKIALVIPIHNRIEISKQGINNIQKSIRYYQANGLGQCDIHIIVVDDGSTDGSSEWINLNYPEITTLKGDGSLWWTGAMNKGTRYAVDELKVNYVLLWNDDTMCSDNYFCELEKILSNPNMVNSILVSKIFYLQEPNKLFNFGCYYDRKSGRKKLIGYKQVDSGEFDNIISIDWSGGMGTLIPAEVLKSVNYFDDQHFPHYHGDSDFFLRAQKQGYKAFAIPTLKIWNDSDPNGGNPIKSLKSFQNALFSNRSNNNIKQNYLFVHRHSNTVYSWLSFGLYYLRFFAKSVKTTIQR